jgi:predicted nucleic acid-binding protein
LLVPDLTAWETAGVVMHRLLTLEKGKTGRRPAWSNDKKQSLIRDVLIAVSAKQQGVTVISDNKDFPLLQQV